MEMAKPSSETSSRKNALNASSRTAKWMEERSGGNSSKCGAGVAGSDREINGNGEAQQRDKQQKERAQRIKPHGEVDGGKERRQQFEVRGGRAGTAGEEHQRGQQPAQGGNHRHAETEAIRQPFAAQKQQPAARPERVSAEGRHQQHGGGEVHAQLPSAGSSRWPGMRGELRPALVAAFA